MYQQNVVLFNNLNMLIGWYNVVTYKNPD